jgi:hypothetical protein
LASSVSRNAGGLAQTAGLGERLRIVVDELHLARILRERRLEAVDGEVELAGFHQHVRGHRLDHRMRRRHLLEL